MGARQASAASRSTQGDSERLGRPLELAAILRALALRPRGRTPAALSLGDSQSPVPECLHQPRGRSRRCSARQARRRRIGLEGVRRRAGRSNRAPDELSDRRGPGTRRAGAGVVQDWLLPLREEYYAPQEAYLDHLAKLIEAIGRAGESILVGRGAGFMLPRDTTLSIRVVAPVKERASRLAERMGVSVAHCQAGRPRARSPPHPV